MCVHICKHMYEPRLIFRYSLLGDGLGCSELRGGFETGEKSEGRKEGEREG